MSAYALPGLLFPPLPSCFDTYGDRSSSVNVPNYHHHHHHHSIHNQEEERIHINSCLTKTNASYYDVHYESSTDTSYKEKCCHPPQNSSVSTTAVSSRSSNTSNSEEQLHISIIDAKIDAIRLIQSFMSSSKPSSKLRRARPYSSSSSQYRSNNNNKKNHPTSTNDFYDECMIFTFQIVKSNQETVGDDPASMKSKDIHSSTSTISRTLQQITQFCDDIICHSNDDTTGTDIPNLHQLIHHCCDETAIVVNNNNNNNNNTVPTNHYKLQQRRSFAYLQDQIRIYTPVIEQWIRTVYRSILLQEATLLQRYDTTFTSTTNNSARHIWNDFVHVDIGPLVNENYIDHQTTGGMTTFHAASSLIKTTIDHEEMGVVSTNTTNTPFLQSHHHTFLYNGKQNNNIGNNRSCHSTMKLKRMKPRRIVSMESIDEEEIIE